MITVGQSNADIIGSNNNAIQAAIDMVCYRGGGTVRLLPGEYTLSNALYLRSNVNLIGDKEKTILKREPAVSSRLLIDADLYQKEITPKDPSLFKVGMGIICIDNEPMNDMTPNRPLTIVRNANGVLYLNEYIQYDFTADKHVHGREYNGVVTNAFPMIMGENVEDVIVDGFTVDAQTNEDPAWENLQISGGVYFKTCRNSVIRNVKSINIHGDGIRVARASKNIIVEDCESTCNTHYGMHPGSHSTDLTVQRCHIHHNGSDGLYICWGIRNSKFLNNDIHHNGFSCSGDRNGISIGHKDTDNLIAGNHLYENAVSGIHFRIKTEANGAHHNIIRDNIIENNCVAGHGKSNGYGIYISGITHDILIENKSIRETRGGNDRLQKNAVYIEPGVTQIRMINNKISGHPADAVIDNSKSPDNILQSANQD
jgi:hypothetical protein